MNDHAERIAIQQREMAMWRAKINAEKVLGVTEPFGGKSRETSFCGKRSAFAGCVPKRQSSDRYYSTEWRDME